jgi:Fe(3+) dicitrate transport protein
MFYEDPTQSARSRNYFEPDIYVPSVTLNWQLSERTTLQWIFSGVFGARCSVEFEGFADRPDTIDAVTLEYKPRAVNIDNFNSRTSELRLLHLLLNVPIKIWRMHSDIVPKLEFQEGPLPGLSTS